MKFDDFNMEYIQKKLELAINNLRYFDENGKLKDERFVQEMLINSLSLHGGDPLIDEYCVNPFILIEFARQLAFKLGDRDSHRFLNLQDDKLLKKSSKIIRIRKFPHQNHYYYGYPFIAKDTLYSFVNGVPFLITVASKKSISETKFNELTFGDMIREEIRVLTSLSFIHTYGPCTFSFIGKPVMIPNKSFLTHKRGVSSEELIKRESSVYRLIEKINFYPNQEPSYNDAFYNFKTEDTDDSKVREFYNSFDIKNELLLRTSFLLLKSNILYHSHRHLFGEEACANLFFALEGTLRLLHRRFFGDDNFRAKQVVEAISQTFTYAPGYRWMIEDAYSKRVSIVHPETKLGSKWFTFLMADDYYENFEMTIDFLYFAVTNKFLKNYDL